MCLMYQTVHHVAIELRELERPRSDETGPDGRNIMTVLTSADCPIRFDCPPFTSSIHSDATTLPSLRARVISGWCKK